VNNAERIRGAAALSRLIFQLKMATAFQEISAGAYLRNQARFISSVRASPDRMRRAPAASSLSPRIKGTIPLCIGQFVNHSTTSNVGERRWLHERAINRGTGPAISGLVRLFQGSEVIST